MKLKKLLLFLTIASTQFAQAQEVVKDLFVRAPFKVVPTVSRTTRLDMIDYFESGMSRPSASAFGDDVAVTELTPGSITASLSPNTKVSISTAPLPTSADTAIVVIETVNTPAPDSFVTVYDKNWNALFELHAGIIDQWLNQQGEKNKAHNEVENIIGFITAQGSYNPDELTLTFVNTSDERVTATDYAKVRPFLKETRTFRLNPKGFKEIK